MHIKDLVELLNYHTKLYDEGKPEINDKEWDDLYFQLQKQEEETGIILSDSPTQKIDYQVISSLNKVEHNHPMLSLNKTKSIDDIINFSNNKQLNCMAKVDGLTCSLRYLNGELVSAETRGNGLIGEDITHNIKHVKEIPLTLPNKDEVIVDGEIIITIPDFGAFKNEYANPRNFAAGSIRLLDSEECAKRKLTFIVWDCIKGLDKIENLSEKLIYLSEWGFHPTPWLPLLEGWANESKLIHIKILLQDWAKEEGIPIDGLVFKYDNCEYYNSLGATGHHFRGGLAYKFYDEQYETELLDIEWSMGRTGDLTPIAIFNPVEIDDTIVERASLHNLSVMKQMMGTPYKNQSIKISKRNMIIPQIEWADKDIKDNRQYEFLHPPITCPSCGHPTKVRTDNESSVLFCTNPQCEGKLINQLKHFVSKKGLDIRGLSEATLQKLIDWGWVGDKIEIFSLNNFRKEWIKKQGFGVKSVDNILNAIEASKNCELYQFISALGIPLIGETYAKEICKQEYSWHNIREDIKGEYDFTQWDGFGYEMNKSLYEFNYTEADEIANLLNITNSLFNKKSDIDIKVCITGTLNKFKNRAELTSEIEKIGGKVTNSVSKNTDILVNNDINSNSSKNQNAKKFGVPIMTEEEFIEKYLT